MPSQRCSRSLMVSAASTMPAEQVANTLNERPVVDRPSLMTASASALLLAAVVLLDLAVVIFDLRLAPLPFDLAQLLMDRHGLLVKRLIVASVRHDLRGPAPKEFVAGSIVRDRDLVRCGVRSFVPLDFLLQFVTEKFPTTLAGRLAAWPVGHRLAGGDFDRPTSGGGRPLASASNSGRSPVSVWRRCPCPASAEPDSRLLLIFVRHMRHA